MVLKGTALSGSTVGSGFSSKFLISHDGVAPLLNVGSNTLYINATDVGGPAGLLISATVETVIPEPSSA